MIPLAGWADRQLAALTALAPCEPLRALDGATLLGERAALNGLRIPGALAAGGGCHLWATADGHVALNLARPDDRELLPALFGDAEVNGEDFDEIAATLARCPAGEIVARGRQLGLALADLDEAPASPPSTVAVDGLPAICASARPLVIDLSALWAGPLAASLLGLAGAEVIKVESRSRPDALRQGDPALFARLNGGKDSLALDLHAPFERDALVALLRSAGVVIEAARPRALCQLGIDAEAIVGETPGLVWVTITGHGLAGEAQHWVGFGDDCGIAGGLGAALRDATGTIGFVGDAIADPLSGIAAARAALERRRLGRGGRLVVAMAAVAADALRWERERDPAGLDRTLRTWAANLGQPFPSVPERPSAPVHPLAADNGVWLENWCAC